jgi:hypothetical protein
VVKRCAFCEKEITSTVYQQYAQGKFYCHSICKYRAAEKYYQDNPRPPQGSYAARLRREKRK